MSSNGPSGQLDPVAPGHGTTDDAPRTRWQKFRLVVKVVELRLRFIALMAVTGLVFAYWDYLWNRYDKWMRPTAGAHAAASGLEYYCPMHPQVVQEAQGTCPICGMPLAKRKKGEKATLPAGVTARVELEPFRVAQAGIKTAEVQYAPLTQTLTTVGYVAFDERAMANIVSRVPGKTRVETLYVNFNGQDVAEGQTLAELYSPELSQAVHELLTSAHRSEAAPQPHSAVARSLVADRHEMVRASAEKLKRWGITQGQIDEILKTGRTNFTFPILSPVSGHVFKKNVVKGQEVQEGYAMFEVANLHTVWVQAHVYEHQLGLIHLGQPVEATVEALPGKTFPGTVEFIQPHLDPATRTVEVRYALENPDHQLRPGMFATVTLKTPVAETPEFQARLTPAERSAQTNEAQKTCPVTGAELGTMGPPVSVEVNGRKVWLCCDACPPKIKANPAKYMAKVMAYQSPISGTADQTAEQQKTCPVTNLKLGSMGNPIAVEVAGRKVWTCCDTCPPKLKASPAKYLAKLAPEAPVAAKAQTIAEQKICPVTGAKLGSMGDPILVEVEGRKIWTCCSACPPKLKAQPARYLARLAPPPRDGVLTIPESAVIDTGNRKIVYVESEPGVFEGREVVLGPRTGDRFPVLEGLAPGDKVAASGAFLIDAESRINPGAVPAAPEESAPATESAPLTPPTTRSPSAAATPEGTLR
jgi:Cu(I)/Ag(I) efflux system membrane fusion protein